MAAFEYIVLKSDYRSYSEAKKTAYSLQVAIVSDGKNGTEKNIWQQH